MICHARLILILAVMLAPTLAMAQDVHAAVLATVGDFNVTPPYVDHVIRNHFAREVMSHIIRGRVIADEAAAQGVRVSHDQVTAAIDSEKSGFLSEDAFATHVRRQGFTTKGYREHVHTQLLLTALLDQAAEISDADAEAYFAAHQDEFGTRTQLRILHLAAATQGDALVAYRAILDGTPFAVAARRFSADPDAAGDGDLGWVEQGTVPVEGLWQFAEALAEGQLTAPFKLDDSYHIVKVLGRRSAAAVEFADVKDQIREQLRSGSGISEEDYVTGLLAAADISVTWTPVQYLAEEFKRLKGVRIEVDSRPLDLTTGAFVAEDDVLMIPAKSVLRAVGAEITWRAAAKVLEARRAGVTARISLGEKTCVVNGEFKSMEAPPVIRDGATFISPDTVLSSLGIKVEWNPATRLLSLSTMPQ